MWLIAPASRIEFSQWRDQRLKILGEEIMVLFCGPGLEATHTVRVTFVILFWSDLNLHFWSHGIHAMPDSLEPEPRSQLILCHFCRGSLQPTTNFELLNYLKFFQFFACEAQRVVARWQEILWSRDEKKSDYDFPFLSGYRSRPQLGGSRILAWFSQ
jgi:hypothetical protein